MDKITRLVDDNVKHTGMNANIVTTFTYIQYTVRHTFFSVTTVIQLPAAGTDHRKVAIPVILLFLPTSGYPELSL